MDNRKLQTRKKFLGIGLTSAALLTAFRFLVPEKKEPEKETVKMLARDGQLVEVSVDKIGGKGKKISNQQLQTWVKK